MLGLLRQVPGEDKSPWKLFLLLAKVWSWITRAIAVLSECMGIVKVRLWELLWGIKQTCFFRWWLDFVWGCCWHKGLVCLICRWCFKWLWPSTFTSLIGFYSTCRIEGKTSVRQRHRSISLWNKIRLPDRFGDVKSSEKLPCPICFRTACCSERGKFAASSPSEFTASLLKPCPGCCSHQPVPQGGLGQLWNITECYTTGQDVRRATSRMFFAYHTNMS